ncbi:MAG: glycosyltransferase family 39 protein [Christensenella sp.]|nr:glycosyltransferase family 39 protein [Christensenella sp.]
MSKSRQNSALLFGALPYLLTAALVIAAYTVIQWQLHLNEKSIRLLMLAGILAYTAVGTFLLLKKRKNWPEVLIAGIIALGMFLRIGYMLYTNVQLRAHDISDFHASGHLDYVYQIFSTGTLPATNEVQFYHPPLQHILQAIVVKIYALIRPDTDLYALFESAKIVPCTATCSLLFVFRSICRELKLGPRASVIAMAIFAFQPTFYLLSSSINNDALMLLFYGTAILYTICWYHKPNMKNILLLALSVGCGMMTKISAATVAFLIAPVFLVVLIQHGKRGKAAPLVGQFGAFLGVSVPLGFWYPVRNWIKFGQPLNYVLTINLPQLYCGDRSIAERFFSIPVREIWNPLFCEPFGDYRLWLYTIKCSVFGEYSYDQSHILGKALVLTNLLLMTLSLAAMIYLLFRGNDVHPLVRLGLVWLWLIQICFFVLFNIRFPYGCTMDFRYIVPTVIVGAIALSLALERIKRKHTTTGNLVFAVGVAAVTAYSVVSMLFYTL